MDDPLLSLDCSFLSAASCTDWLRRFDQPDLISLAVQQHRRDLEQAAGKQVPRHMVRAFLFDRDVGECAVVVAISGSYLGKQNGYDGLSLRFQPSELAQAVAGLVWFSNILTAPSTS